MALKRANGEGNLRKRSNGTWEARVTLGTDPKTGKLISKSVYARTQKECREKMKALLGIDGGQAATPPAAPKEPPKPKPDRKSTRLNSSHSGESRMPSSA